MMAATNNHEQQQQQQGQKTSMVAHWPEEEVTTNNNNSHTTTRWVQLLFRRWSYSYMNRIFDKGSRQMRPDGAQLTYKDLYPAPPSMASNLLLAKFLDAYRANEGQKNRVVHIIWQLAKPTFVPAGVCQLVTVLCQVAVPPMVRQLLLVLQDHPSQQVIGQGIPYVLAIFILLALNAIFTHRQRHLATKSGIVLRAAMTNVIYVHALRLTPQGRVGLNSGEVTNLVAIDTQKLFEVTQEGHLIWSMPLSIILVTVLLLIVMGPTTLVGIAVLVAFVPIVERLASFILKIRQQRVKLTDKRIEIVNAMLQGIKVTKLNNYEESYQKRIEAARNRELVYLRRELALWAMTLVVMVTSPVLASAATFATFALVGNDHQLTSGTTFTVLLLFSALRFPINYAGRLMGRVAQAVGSLRRITAFLERETRADDHKVVTETKKLLMEDGTEHSKMIRSQNGSPLELIVQHGSFRIGATFSERDEETSELNGGPRTGFEVTGVNITVKPGQILAVCGPVGSGKSTLTLGLIDEVASSPKTIISIPGRVAYVSQTPFILNATLRDNILFGLPLERDRYEQVLDACCLRADIEQLGGAGDMTEIGERGVTLSGGQKQRVSLARAAYSQPDVVLCDDPLSALDAGTAKKVFEKLFRSASSPAIFANAAVLLVTHASHFLNRVDQVMVMVDGQASFVGTWDELSQFKPTGPRAVAAVEFIQKSVQEEGLDDEDEKGNNVDESNNVIKTTGDDSAVLKKDSKGADGTLIAAETREHGLSRLSTWLLWFKHAGGIPFLLFQVVLMTTDRFAYVATEYWLARWTQGADQPVTVYGAEFAPQSDGRQAQYDYLKVYATILAISIFSTMARSEWVVTGGARCGKKVFYSMLSSTLKAPMSYFETTPMGRILNRYTYDTEIVDVSLTEAMSVLLIACSWFVAAVVIMCTILPWTALVIFPATIIYGFLALHYRRSGADLQRLDAVSRSPIQAAVAEGIDGASTIRVYGQETSFVSKFQDTVDRNSSALLNFVSAQRWLGVRIEVLGSFVVFVSCILVISLNNTLHLQPGIVGLLIIWSVNFTITLGFLVDNFAEAEGAITSIERVDAMSRLPEEKSMITTGVALPPSWPESGCLEFRDVYLKYREGLPFVLNGLTFTVPARKRCAVVGRTGAGKSSLTVALFRLVEIDSGSILLDGVDLSLIGLRDVRGRGMSIIPQDPFLAGTTLRECLDPFGRSTNAEILDALKAVRIASPTQGFEVLDFALEEGGTNFSVGERQLLNLARALLVQPRLLVLDEATASVDGETDAFIQRLMRTRFKDTTILTVAHRLNTVMDYDLILVMDSGKAVEFGSPEELLSRPNGVFLGLVNATGAESAKALKALVSSI